MNDYPERFERAINKLVDAFFDGTLEAGSCSRCAVGNILNNEKEWYHFTHELTELSAFSRGRQVVASSDYSKDEILRIEKAFENAGLLNVKRNSTEDQYNRLMAVVDVLMDIEDIDQEEHEQEIKQMFAYS